jgi:hypothetical protein
MGGNTPPSFDRHSGADQREMFVAAGVLEVSTAFEGKDSISVLGQIFNARRRRMDVLKVRNATFAVRSITMYDAAFMAR